MTLYKSGDIVADYFFDGKDTTPYNWFQESKLTLVTKGPDLTQCKYRICPCTTIRPFSEPFPLLVLRDYIPCFVGP